MFSLLNEVYFYNKAVERRCSTKKTFLENFVKFSSKHLCGSLFFDKVTSGWAAYFWRTFSECLFYRNVVAPAVPHLFVIPAQISNPCFDLKSMLPRFEISLPRFEIPAPICNLFTSI